MGTAHGGHGEDAPREVGEARRGEDEHVLLVRVRARVRARVRVGNRARVRNRVRVREW